MAAVDDILNAAGFGQPQQPQMPALQGGANPIDQILSTAGFGEIPTDVKMGDFFGQPQPPAAPVAPPLPDEHKLKNFWGGLKRGTYDLKQGALELGGSALDTVGLTKDARGTIHNIMEDPQDYQNAGYNQDSPAFRTGRFITSVGSSLPFGGMKVAEGAGPLISTVNNLARGGAASIPGIPSSPLDPKMQVMIGSGLGAAAPALAKYAPLVGAGVGGVYGAAHDPGNPVWGGVTGAGTGLMAGAGLQLAGRGAMNVANRLMRRAPEVDEDLLNGAQYVADSRNGGMTYDELRASTAPTTAQAMGPRGRVNAKALVSRGTGTAGDTVESTLNPYNSTQSRNGRVLSMVEQNFGVDPAAAQGEMDNVLAEGRKAAKPWYIRAFSGGSTAPLATQYEKQIASINQQGDQTLANHQAQFNETGKELNQALTEQQTIENRITFLKKKESLLGIDERQGNVYAANGINQDLKIAEAELDKANERVGFARDAHNAVHDAIQDHPNVMAGQRKQYEEMLGKAREDEANGVRGGIWTPRLARLTSNPLVRKGIPRGLESMRNEADIAGEPFNPTEHGITGYDANGEPIVANVPNMRLYDAMKRGLDAQLEEYRDPVTKLIDFKNNKRAQEIDGLRREFLKELDRVNPEYAQARAVAGDTLSAYDMFNRAKGITDDKLTAANFKSIWDKMTSSQQRAYKGGVANLFFNQSEPGKLDPKKVLNHLAYQKLEIMLGKDAADRFTAGMQQEVNNMNFRNYALPGAGSPTIPLSEAIRGQNTFGEAGNAAEEFEHRISSGQGPVQAGRSTLGSAAGKIFGSLKSPGLSEKARDEAARIFMMSPKEAADHLEKMHVLINKEPPEAIPFGIPGMTASQLGRLVGY